MAHTERMRVATADAKATQKISGGAVAAKSTPPIAGMIMTPITNVNDPRINNVQAVIVTRALNISGISPSLRFY